MLNKRPAPAVRALMAVERLPKSLAEPCCGSGAILNVLRVKAMSAEQRRAFLEWATQNIDAEIEEPPAPPRDTARAIEEAGGVEAFIQQMKVTAVARGLSVKAAKDVLVAEYLDRVGGQREF